MSDKKPVIITITISPPAGGKRKVLVSGAPQGEMPIIERGLFPELHTLIDRVWVTLATREPQVVDKATAAAQELSGTSQPAAVSEENNEQVVPPDELPEIEGDNLDSQEDTDE